MLILLDCRPLQNAGFDSEKSRFVLSIVAALSRDPDLQLLGVADRSRPLPELPGVLFIRPRILGGRLGWRRWYDWQLPRLAKKHRADLVMTTGGIAARGPLPQCLWMPERANPKEGQGYVPTYAGCLTESLRRATTVFCFSIRDRNWLAARAEQGREKPIVLHPSPEGSGPLPMTEREKVKADVAGGREYFFADTAGKGEEAVIHLLKAFSLFKKRQLSNLPLVIKGIPAESLQKKLETYKYREDILWCSPSADRVSRAAAAAYAGLFLFDGQSLGTPVLDAWKAGVPVILTAGGPLQDLAGEAALTVDGADPASLAAQLMAVYKDEALRSRLIGLGLSRLTEFDAELAINTVRKAIITIKK